MKIKIASLILTILCSFNYISAEKIAEFPDVTRPTKIHIDGNVIYITEASVKVSAYSLDDFKFIQTFGRKGEGPGEFRRTPYLKILPESLFFGTFERIYYFSKAGKLLDEKRLTFLFRVLPAAKKFISFRVRNTETKRYRSIHLLDKNMQSVQVLHTQEHEIARSRGVFFPIRSYLGMDTYKDKIFIADSDYGLAIKVFNDQGKELYTIKTETENIRITNEYKEQFISENERHPTNGAEWRIVTQTYKLEYPKYFPAIREFFVTDGKIFVQTNKRQGDDAEFFIMDLKGNIQKQGFFPQFENGSVVDRFVYTFTKDAYYYLTFNLDANTWELNKIPY